MSQILQVHVTLKIPDAIANTAISTLRRRMGFSYISSLKRTEWWKVEFNEDCEDAKSLLKELVEHTSIFMNPNKHAYRIYPGDVPPACGSETSCHVLVRDSDDMDANAALELLSRHPLCAVKLSGLHRGALWTVAVKDGSEKTGREVAQSIALSTSRDQGLLANPHYQTATIFP
jgi:hypothetical protein